MVTKSLRFGIFMVLYGLNDRSIHAGSNGISNWYFKPRCDWLTVVTWLAENAIQPESIWNPY